jgi:hypothetical protein
MQHFELTEPGGGAVAADGSGMEEKEGKKEGWRG